MTISKIAALFDLDGVIFDTEPQYSLFWKEMGHEYGFQRQDLGSIIKGQTLNAILENWFSGDMEKCRPGLIGKLNAFESRIKFEYIPGFESWVKDLRLRGIKSAVVTSSNRLKMSHVYASHPEFKGYFDAILTEEDFTKSKPAPECYLLAAERLGVAPEECVVFEDSRNGLAAAQAAGMFTVGLTTTLPPEIVATLSDRQFPDFTAMRWDDFR